MAVLPRNFLSCKHFQTFANCMQFSSATVCGNCKKKIKRYPDRNFGLKKIVKSKESFHNRVIWAVF